MHHANVGAIVLVVVAVVIFMAAARPAQREDGR